MKRLGWLLGVVLMLTGCSGPVWETVNDVVLQEQVPVWQEEAYELQLGVPEEAALLLENDVCSLYSTANGELEVETITFLASGLESAVKTVSGFSAEDLTILRTSRFDLPEYQFAWVSQTEQGARLYRADVIMDGMRCYAVVCSSLENAGDYYAFQARQVFSTFGLSGDSGV